MTKPKSRSEVDHLRGEIKKLKKKLTRKEKVKFSYEEEEADAFVKEDIQERKTLNKSVCPRCKAFLDIIGGDKIKIYICPDCPYRASVRV